MDANRKRAGIAGLLFIVAAVTSIIGLLLYTPILHDPAYIAKASTSETQVLWGVFFEVLLAFSIIGTSVTLFLVLRKQNESMAIGTVCFRLLEATLIIIGILSLLTIVTLNHQFLKESHPITPAYLMTGKLLIAIHNWTFLYGPNLILGPSTFFTAYLLHRLKLVPRFITVTGIIGGPLISACAILVTFGLFAQLSFWGGVLAIPVFCYEMSLAAWLIAKGFNPPPAIASVPEIITRFGRD